MSEQEQPWLTLAGFVAYWRARSDANASPGHVWVLTGRSEPGHPKDGPFPFLAQVYSSPFAMLAAQVGPYLGPELTARITWRVSPYNGRFWEGYAQRDDGTEDYYSFVEQEIDSECPSGEIEWPTLGDALVLSPATDPYAEAAA